MKTRESRFEIRLSAEAKELIAQAAAIRRQDLASFSREVLLKEAADIVVASFPTKTITRRDLRAILDALEHPRRPNAALKAAVCRFKDVRED